jgi:hypothetical protein
MSVLFTVWPTDAFFFLDLALAVHGAVTEPAISGK